MSWSDARSVDAAGSEGEARPRVAIVGGPDVDARIPLIDRLRHRYRFRGIGSEPSLAARFSAAGLRYDHYPLPRGFDLGADLRAARHLAGLLRRDPVDLVHCFDTKPAIFARLASRFAGVPAIVGTLPGLGGLYASSSARVRRRRFLFDRLQFVASDLSSWTVFQNRDDRALLVERGIVPAGRSSVIDGSGVDPARYDRTRLTDAESRRRALAELGIVAGALDGPILLYVGRWIHAKGILDLAHAVDRVRIRHPGVVWLALGEPDGGPDSLDESEAEAVRRRAICPGRTDLVDRYLAIADAIVLPTRYREGIPRVLIEAAFAGCPIVTTDTPGCREVVDRGRAGWQIPPGDREALADALDTVLTRRATALAFAERARERAHRFFDLAVIADRHLSLYDHLLRAAGIPIDRASPTSISTLARGGDAS
ncbi:MAG: glycosyltransferase [Planctomycetes bacterium]|nr:glycosyltransferase [Planctomycetota bacterium]